MKNAKFNARRVVLTLLIGVFLLIDVYPVIWLIMSSFKTVGEINSRPMYELPRTLYFENYVNAVKLTNMGMLFKNTVIVSMLSVMVCLVLSAMASFGVTKLQWRGAKIVSNFFRLGMFVPTFVLLLPQFVMFKEMHLLNTLTVLIIIFSAGVSLPIYLLNGFYRYLPNAILEASVIDGCNIYKSFWHIVIPMSLNGYVTVILLTFFGIWNDLLITRTFTSSTELRLIQTGLAAFSGEWGEKDWGGIFAAVTIAVVPTITLYLVMNRKIVDGLSAGALKGES